MKSRKNKFAAFISSRGFYVAIAVCLVGAGIATWLAVDRTISGIEDQNSRILQSETKYQEFPPLEEAAKPQSNVPQRSSSVASAPAVSSAASSKPSTPSSSSPNSASSPTVSSAPPEVSKTQAAQPQSVRLTYALPVKGDIVNSFSKGELVRNVTLGEWRTHDGVDIACEKGTEVVSSAEGKVVDVKQDSLWGGVVTIQHPDGRLTTYSGLAASLPVKAGDMVSARQVIGSVEGIPCESSEPAHLHFALKENGVWADPLSLIAKA